MNVTSEFCIKQIHVNKAYLLVNNSFNMKRITNNIVSWCINRLFGDFIPADTNVYVGLFHINFNFCYSGHRSMPKLALVPWESVILSYLCNK